jgi:hypothetical protein
MKRDGIILDVLGVIAVTIIDELFFANKEEKVEEVQQETEDLGYAVIVEENDKYIS